MLIIEKNQIIAKIDCEEELLLLGLIIEPKDEVEMKIIRNIFSYSNGNKKKIDRIETMAIIKIDSVKYIKETGFIRIKGKIIETEKDVTKGYHAENIKIGSMLKILKNDTEKIKLFIERKGLIKLENKKINLNELSVENVEEMVSYGLLDTLIICLDLFFQKKELVKSCLEKKTKIIISRDKEFCEKIKLAGRRRF